MYLVRGERRHAAWLLVTVFGGAGLGLALKVLVGGARPALPDPVSTAPGHVISVRPRVGRDHRLLPVAPAHACGCCPAAAASPRSSRPLLVVGVVALARVVLGVHFVSDVLAGIMLGIAWVAVTTWAYVAWRRETGQPVARPAEVGSTEQPRAR